MNRRFNFSSTVAAIALLLAAISAHAADDLAFLQSQWAKATYKTPDDQRVDTLKALAEKARSVVAHRPDNPDLLIWKGIIVSSLAGEKGGLGALGLAKEAKASLEAAMEIDPYAMQGSAYTSLGTLYHKVPGWPIGFGSDKKARAHLEKALSINPDGIDSNYFMAEFLFDEGEYSQAQQHLTRAESAQDRPDRPIADAGRRNEVATMRAAVNAKLN